MTGVPLPNVDDDVILFLKLPFSVQNPSHPRNILVIQKLVQNLSLQGKEDRHVQLDTGNHTARDTSSRRSRRIISTFFVLTRDVRSQVSVRDA